MNKIYRVIWNASKQAWQVVSELASGRVKSATTSKKSTNVHRTFRLTALGALFISPAVMAVPYTVIGGEVNNSTGNTAMAIGAGSQVTTYVDSNGNTTYGRYSTALGTNTTASGDLSTALGGNATSGNAATAIGSNVIASGSNSVSVGLSSQAKGFRDVYIGESAGATTTSDGYNVGVGASAGRNVTGSYNVAFGASAGSGTAGTQNIAIGTAANSVANGATAVTSSNNTAIGQRAYANGIVDTDGGTSGPGSATAVGDRAIANGSNSVSLGSGATTTAAHAISIGSRSIANGTNATAVGYRATAVGSASAAIGYFANATGSTANAFGSNASASGGNTTAIGTNANASGAGSIVIGSSASSTSGGISAIVLGSAAVASNQRAIAVGELANATGWYSVAVGRGARTAGLNTIAIGNASTATGNASMAIGSTSTATGNTSIAMGSQTNASAISAVAIGNTSTATGNTSIAMGSEANANGSDSIAIGTDAKTGISNWYSAESVAIGKNAIGNRTSVAIGSNTTTGELSVAIGNTAGNQAYSAVSIGDNAGSNSTSNGFGVSLGQKAGMNVNGVQNVAVGKHSGNNVTGNTNYALGTEAGNNVTGHDNWASLIGAGSNVIGTNNIAIGKNSGNNIAANNTISMGSTSKAINDNAIALGAGSQAGKNAIAIGGTSVTGVDSIDATKLPGTGSIASGENSIALGYGAQAIAINSISIGTGNVVTGNNSGAIGDPTTITGTGTYTLGNNNGVVSANEAGIFGNNNTLTADNSRIIGNNNNVSTGSVSSAFAFGNNNTLTSALHSFVIGNNNTLSNMLNTFVVGTNVTATQSESVILGNNSTDRPGTLVPFAIVGNLLYGNFAGQTGAPNGVVSVGGVGTERQIINVGAGDVSSTSTDAINGSQLYFVADAISNVATSTISILGGNAVMDAIGNIVMSDIGGTGATNINDAIQIVNNNANASAVHFYSATGGSSTSGNYNNDGATGLSALAAGVNASAAGNNSIAIGSNATSPYVGTIALGSDANVTGDRGVSIGTNSTAQEDSVALGTNANASGVSSVAIGNNANSSMLYSVAIGENSTTTTAQAATAVGQGSTVTAENGSAFGNGANATARYAVGLGYYAKASDNMSVALGSESTTEVAVATANATVGGISYDGFAGTDPTSTVSVGSTVAPTGRTATGQPIGGTYVLTRTITNVAAGRVDATSTDAINGSQLYAVTGVIGNLASSTVKVLGGNANVNSNGTITMTNIGNTNQNTIHDAIDSIRQTATNATSAASQPLTFAGDTGTNVSRQLGSTVNVVGGQTDASKLTNNNIGVIADGTDTLTVKLAENIDLGSTGSVTTGNTTVNNSGVAVGNNVTLTDTGLTVGNVSVTTSGINAGGSKITGVAAGDITATSTDAVNGSQLYSVQQQITASVQSVKTEVKGSDGTVTVTPSSGDKGQNVYDVKVNTTSLTTNSNGTVAVPTSTNSFATAQDVANAINNSGWNLNSTATGTGQVTGDTSPALVNAGSTVNINAGNNIVIDRTGNNITVATSMTPTFTSVTATDSIGITNGPSMNTAGINAANKTITNVADGVNDTDAVNVRQLREATGNSTAITNLDGKVNRMQKDLRAGIAGAVATAGLPQAYMPGKSMMAASAGTYKNEGALAVGYSRASDNGKVVIKLTGSASTRGDYTGSVGMGYQW